MTQARDITAALAGIAGACAAASPFLEGAPWWARVLVAALGAGIAAAARVRRQARRKLHFGDVCPECERVETRTNGSRDV